MQIRLCIACSPVVPLWARSQLVANSAAKIIFVYFHKPLSYNVEPVLFAIIRKFIFLFQPDYSEAGVLKKLSLAGLAKLSQLRYSRLRFGLASAGYHGLGVCDRPVYTTGQLTADSTEQYEIPGVSPLSLAERG
jgi:hypothetical protein